ncbi:hypothetical protein CHUAL_004928 [Chamberlinius hualienensis]
MSTREKPGFFMSLMSGAAAGMSVDLTLFPLDTLKTRLQSENGFAASGGFRGVYRGIGSALMGSAPNAALFFVTYDTMKKLLQPHFSESSQSIVHMSSAALGEVVACIVRVPVEVVKQRTQASPNHSSYYMLKKTLNNEGFRGLYRGYISTVSREIPFAFIQYPLWELFKKSWSSSQNRYVDSWQAAICGAAAGGISAAITTPLDVAKTRIMLAEKGSLTAKGNIIQVLTAVSAERGIKGIFAGIVPRVMWISIGGSVFFGVYEKSKSLLERVF